MRYNKKKVRYISPEDVGKTEGRFIRSELARIYGNRDGIVNELAIPHGETVYIVDSGREKGNITFGIRRRRKISDTNLKSEIIRSINNDAISNGCVSDGLSSKVKGELGGDSGRSMRRKFGEELQSDSKQSDNYQEGIFGDHGDNGGVKFSKKSISHEAELTEATRNLNYDQDLTRKRRKWGATDMQVEETMNRYQMGVLVMDCLQALNVDMDIVLKAINTRNLDKSFKLIQENPKITKVEFLERMGLTEE